jgi:hypothetical protein
VGCCAKRRGPAALRPWTCRCRVHGRGIGIGQGPIKWARMMRESALGVKEGAVLPAFIYEQSANAHRYLASALTESPLLSDLRACALCFVLLPRSHFAHRSSLLAARTLLWPSAHRSSLLHYQHTQRVCIMLSCNKTTNSPGNKRISNGGSSRRGHVIASTGCLGQLVDGKSL